MGVRAGRERGGELLEGSLERLGGGGVALDGIFPQTYNLNKLYIYTSEKAPILLTVKLKYTIDLVFYDIIRSNKLNLFALAWSACLRVNFLPSKEP